MKNICILFILLFGVNLIVSAQTEVIETVQPVEVKVTKDLQKIYVHKLKPNETLYKLSRVFDLPVVYLEKINQIESGAVLGVGSEIIVPIKDEIITSQKRSDTDIPVIYQVKERETIFRISRIYFDKQIEDIKHLNNLKDLQLDINQQLQIGWVDLRDPNLQDATSEVDVPVNADEPSQTIKSVEPAQQEENPIEMFDDVVIKDESVTPSDIIEDVEDNDLFTPEATRDSIITVVETEVDSISIEPVKAVAPVGTPMYKRGIAFWNKNSTSTDLFVMHDEAKVNTQIELYNPLVNKRIIATVVARVPKSAYPGDINLVLSPAVAKNLGAIDSRFSVEMKYYK